VRHGTTPERCCRVDGTCTTGPYRGSIPPTAQSSLTPRKRNFGPEVGWSGSPSLRDWLRSFHLPDVQGVPWSQRPLVPWSSPERALHPDSTSLHEYIEQRYTTLLVPVVPVVSIRLGVVASAGFRLVGEQWCLLGDSRCRGCASDVRGLCGSSLKARSSSARYSTVCNLA
jgi:hypothetical protein